MVRADIFTGSLAVFIPAALDFFQNPARPQKWVRTNFSILSQLVKFAFPASLGASPRGNLSDSYNSAAPPEENPNFLLNQS